MTKLELAKVVTSSIVGIGTGQIVAQVIKNNAAPENWHQTVTMTAGAFTLGAIVADISKKYTNQKIDEIASWWTANIKPKFND